MKQAANYLKKVNDDYRKIIDTSSAPKAIVQYYEMIVKMLKNDFTMKGNPFPTFLKPYFVDKSLAAAFAESTRHIMSAAEKVADLYFTAPEFRPYYEVDESDRAFIEIQPRYPNRVINARLDAFLYEDGSIKFLEFNCDSPSGMGWHDRLIDFFKALPAVKELSKKHPLHFDPLLPKFHNMLMKKYRQEGGKKAKPVFAIVCNDDSSIRNDVQIIVDVFNKKFDHKTIYADPRDCETRKGQLYMAGQPVDVLFRDSISEFTAELKKTKPVLDAFREGRVTFVNPFCSRVGGLKAVLWILTDEKTQHLFTADERKAIAACIPFTRLMKEGKTVYRGKQIDLFPFVAKNKDLFVLKPNSGFGGNDVFLGNETEQKKWDDVVSRCKKSNWVVQEFVPIPKEEFPTFTPGLGWKPKNVNVNFFAHDGQYSGGFVRVADGSIINVHQGGGLLPMAFVGKK